VAKHQSRFGAELLCELLGLSRSSFYYDVVKEVDDGVRAAIVSIAEEFPTYGYRMIQKELERRLVTVNTKRVRRLMREENLVIQVRRFVTTSEYRRGTRDWPNLLKSQAFTTLNAAWAADITYIDLGREFVYLAVIIDVFSRGIRGWHLDRDLSSELTHRALDRALAKHGPPKIHHSDHGVQYLANGYIEKLQGHGIAVSCSAKGKPMQNGKCERFIRTLKESEVSLNAYEDLADARRRIRRFLEDVYMRKRIHSALGYVTPAEFEAAYRTKTRTKSARR
jgi:putative transposase